MHRANYSSLRRVVVPAFGKVFAPRIAAAFLLLILARTNNHAKSDGNHPPPLGGGRRLFRLPILAKVEDRTNLAAVIHQAVGIFEPVVNLDDNQGAA